MKKKNNLLFVSRIIVEIVSLAVLILLIKDQKLQMWFLLFLAGALISLFFGRLFCGWICPMNTLFRVINAVYGKLHIKRFKTPPLLSGNMVRYLFLALLIASMAAVNIFGLHMNILLYIIIFSVLVTMVFTEEFWHRHLCPFGTILSLTSRPARFNLKIEEEHCISCGICQKRCPTGSIETLDNKKRQNKGNECLLCFQCSRVCPPSVCNFH